MTYQGEDRVSSKRNFDYGIAELAQGLSWREGGIVLMIWAYYDESGEDGEGKLRNLSIGGCVSTIEKWKEFTPRWQQALAQEGLESFHMVDFQAWKGPYDFKLEDGSRDKVKHNRLMNNLLDLMLAYCESFVGYGATSHDKDGFVTPHDSWGGCVKAAVRDVILHGWARHEQPINLVFDRQNHFSTSKIKPFIDYYENGTTKGRVGTVTHGESAKIAPLQAADILAYEIARSQRPNRSERYPLTKLKDGAKQRGINFTLSWGPFP